MMDYTHPFRVQLRLNPRNHAHRFDHDVEDVEDDDLEVTEGRLVRDLVSVENQAHDEARVFVRARRHLKEDTQLCWIFN